MRVDLTDPSSYSSTNEPSDLPPIPVGWYLCQITQAEEMKTKKGDPMIALRFGVEAPAEVEFAGKIVPVAGRLLRYYIPVMGSTLWRVDELLRAITGKNDHQGKAFDIDCEEFIGTVVGVQVSKHREYQGRTIEDVGSVVHFSDERVPKYEGG